MAVIPNKWVEKVKKKRAHETAPFYESAPLSESTLLNAKKPEKRNTNAVRATMVRTLRGVRK